MAVDAPLVPRRSAMVPLRCALHELMSAGLAPSCTDLKDMLGNQRGYRILIDFLSDLFDSCPCRILLPRFVCSIGRFWLCFDSFSCDSLGRGEDSTSNQSRTIQRCKSRQWIAIDIPRGRSRRRLARSAVRLGAHSARIFVVRHHRLSRL